MLRFVLRRLTSTLLVLFAAVTLTFFLVRLAPGGPFTAEKNYPEEALQRLNEYYGLNDPIIVQYTRYLGGLLRGDLGPSFQYPNRTVNEIIATAFPVSLELGMWAMLFALVAGLTAGILAAMHPNTWIDHVPMGLAMTGICVPSFVLGPILVLLLAVLLRWFNVSGWSEPSDRILPAITLGSAYAAYIARLTRGGMLEVLPRDFIRTARAKGVSEWKVIMKHALKPGILPVVSFMGPAVAGIVTGSFVVETVFHIPGLGKMFVAGAFNRDYTLVLGLVVFYATLVCLFNMLADAALALLDPRVRRGIGDSNG